MAEKETLKAQSDPIIYQPRPKRTPGDIKQASEFRAVLTKLATDPAYREQATGDPDLLAKDFKLSLKELSALREIAIMSGADVTLVNKVRADELALRVSGISATDVDVSCCSCCCCCCGETAVVPLAFAV